eukprot:1302575-Rhodomonas_salina.1
MRLARSVLRRHCRRRRSLVQVHPEFVLNAGTRTHSAVQTYAVIVLRLWYKTAQYCSSTMRCVSTRQHVGAWRSLYRGSVHGITEDGESGSTLTSVPDTPHTRMTTYDSTTRSLAYAYASTAACPHASTTPGQYQPARMPVPDTALPAYANLSTGHVLGPA